MQSLRTLITTRYPNEGILAEKQVSLTDRWTRKIGKIPIGISKSWYRKPVPCIEMRSYFFFDKRPALLFQSFVSFFIGPLWMGGFIWIVYTVILKQPLNWAFVAMSSVLAIVVGILNILINLSTTNILAIKKDWIEKKKTIGDMTTITGEVTQYPYFQQVLSKSSGKFHASFVIQYQDI